jgi:hypothetical protein
MLHIEDLVDFTACVICGIIAWRLNRSSVIYGLLTLFMPYILCFVMLFLKKRAEEPQTAEMKCDSCKKIVPQYSKPGQRCPYCGILWESERNLTEKKYVNKFSRLYKW